MRLLETWKETKKTTDFSTFFILMTVSFYLLTFVYKLSMKALIEFTSILAKFKANGWLGLLLTAAIIAGHVH